MAMHPERKQLLGYWRRQWPVGGRACRSWSRWQMTGVSVMVHSVTDMSVIGCLQREYMLFDRYGGHEIISCLL